MVMVCFESPNSITLASTFRWSSSERLIPSSSKFCSKEALPASFAQRIGSRTREPFGV